jgi:phospholipid transport system substrate-binding protein
MNRRFAGRIVAFLLAVASFGLAPAVHAADEAPDTLIKRLSDDVLGAVKNDKTVQSGDINRIIALVDSKIMPHVNFQRMTASAVGPAWRQATPEQKKLLQDEFKTLAGAHLCRCAGPGE